MTKLTTAAQVKQAMLDKIADSLLDAKDATKLKFKPLTAAEVKKLDTPATVSGFYIPYFGLDGKPTKFWRLRYLEDTRKGFDVLAGRKALRYVQPVGGVNEVYLPPFIDWREIAENVEVPIIITEGELKSACATKFGYPTIGLGGVFSFKSTKKGESLLPMLRGITWKGRAVYICYDSDAVTNPMVVMAENQFAETLTGMGALVHITRIPPGPKGQKMGLDDFMLVHEPTDLEDLLRASSEFDKAFALHRMNELVAYVRDPGFIFDFKNNMKLGAVPFTQHAFANYWHDEKVVTMNGEKLVPKQTAQAWLQWKHRTELEKISFLPGQPQIVDGRLNLWNGWAVEPKKGSVRWWNDLLDHLFKGAEPEARKWFEQWCAWPLQHPGAKMASCAVFWGRVQGSGKTMVGTTLMRIYGKYSSEITDTELEDERFDWAENKQFVLADDITGSNSRRLANRIKTMVTQKTLKINPKYIPRYELPDCINYYFTSNDPDAFYLDDGDRRNFIHEVRGVALLKAFRDAYVAWMESEEGIAALFHYLLNLDTSDFDPHGPPYETNAKREMTHITKSDLGSWVADLEHNLDGKLKLPGDLFTAAELLMMYDPANSGKVTANGMARELKRSGYRAPGINGYASQTKFGAVRLYALRNREMWNTASVKDIVAHYEESRSMEPKKAKSQKY